MEGRNWGGDAGVTARVSRGHWSSRPYQLAHPAGTSFVFQSQRGEEKAIYKEKQNLFLSQERTSVLGISGAAFQSILERKLLFLLNG